MVIIGHESPTIQAIMPKLIQDNKESKTAAKPRGKMYTTQHHNDWCTKEKCWAIYHQATEKDTYYIRKNDFSLGIKLFEQEQGELDPGGRRGHPKTL